MPGFEAAHLFGCVRFTLDVWERYLGQPLAWHFRDHYERLEISILPTWNNAQFGYGFLEVGSQFETDGSVLPFSLDFDIIAHEVGHAIILQRARRAGPGHGIPRICRLPGSLLRLRVADRRHAFPVGHRPCARSRRAAISISPIASRAFRNFRRIARYGRRTTQRTMAEFVHGWKNEHDLSEPLTGAIFDILVDIFHESLVARGLISPEVEESCRSRRGRSGRPERRCRTPSTALSRAGPTASARRCSMRATSSGCISPRRYGLSVPTFWTMAMSRRRCSPSTGRDGGTLRRLIDRNFRRRGIGILHAGPRFEPSAATACRRGARSSRVTTAASADELSREIHACEEPVGGANFTRRCFEMAKPPVGIRESILNVSAVYLFGRLVSDLQVVGGKRSRRRCQAAAQRRQQFPERSAPKQCGWSGADLCILLRG